MLNSVNLPSESQNLGWSWGPLTQHPCKTILKYFSTLIFKGESESGEELGQRKGLSGGGTDSPLLLYSQLWSQTCTLHSTKPQSCRGLQGNL